MAWPTANIDTTHMDAATDSPGNARADIKIMADNVNAIKEMRGVAGGVASLDGSGLVPGSQLPTTPANKGGTGQTSYSVGDILYASASGTLTKLSPGTNGHVLTSQGPGNAPVWQAAGGGLTAGTRMPFNQSAAPTGWTKDTSTALNDSIMRIVTGAVGSGGSTAFSTFNAQTSVGATTLSIAQIPSHSHSVGVPIGTSSGTGLVQGSNSQTTSYNTSTGAQGGGGSHTHTITTGIKYNDFIIAQKD